MSERCDMCDDEDLDMCECEECGCLVCRDCLLWAGEIEPMIVCEICWADLCYDFGEDDE